jgi:hypothetical protein
MGSTEYGDEGATGTLYACPAYKAVHEYLGLDPYRSLYQWNDTTGTKEKVIETLRTVAVLEAAKEDIENLTGAQK